MLFNSLHFAIFLPIVFCLYWSVASKTARQQNILLLIASYYFYGCWDWRFLLLLLFSTFLDYYTGIKMSDATTERIKKRWFWLSISANLGFLGVFKYFNFFTDSFVDALSEFGVNISPWTIAIILPVGISFYTFHGLSYVIDIYKGRLPPERSFTDYAVFVSFFPLLVAGPIERATHLLPQVKVKRTFNYSQAVDGLRQILWGLFKKIVIADSVAPFANHIFDNYSDYSGSTLALGAFFFSVQIYCDFSGYSDIALGTARLFGIDLLRNFAYPYFSRDIAEFWRRWHISLSTWFRDYLYIPLGGSKGGMWVKIRNTFIIFLVSGFWHGANWTFIAWGFLNALFIMPSIVLGTNRNNLDIVAQGKLFPNLQEVLQVTITFCLTAFAWIFFRSNNLSEAWHYVTILLSPSLFEMPHFTGITKTIPVLVMVLLFFVIEWFGREEQFAIQRFAFDKPRAVRWSCYMITVFVIAYFSVVTDQQEFIYFQF